ncbi:MAG: citramalate synthase [Angelakisella sp.]|jgi:2-isopropylmalate synthase|nr:citramalate synthase [Angelakisella sp.]
MKPRTIEIFDTTLRDGAQGEGISFSLEDKLNIAQKLCKLGIAFIEAGNPGSNPKDMEFFRRAGELELGQTQLVAFGSTRKKDTPVERDEGCAALLSAGTRWVAIFGKSWDLHVRDVLRTTLPENLRMIRDTVSFLKEQGRQVVFDAEHFFDGYKSDPDFARRAVLAARDAGADRIVLCDTNGGTFPEEIGRITQEMVELLGVPVGIHAHNDTGCAVAAAMAAVEAGASQVQGTYIGFGERCGNTNLSTIIPNLQMKKGYRCIPEDKLVRLGKTARYIAQVTNLVLSPNMPYVGRSAFAHKGGMHVDGVAKNTLSFEHITPESVGNRRQILLSEFAGRTAIAGKIAALDSSITRDSQVTAELIEKLKGLEYQGFAFESAAASFELFALKQLGKYRPAFDLEYFKTLGEQPAVNVERCCSAIVKVRVGESIEMTSAEGDGPVHALDIALRKALEVFYPCLSQVRLIDYKVRVMEGHRATAAIVRVLIESTDGVSTWTTVGCSADIIDASWQALRDSMEYKLMKDGAVSGPVA